jgi:hypothetical protein
MAAMKSTYALLLVLGVGAGLAQGQKLTANDVVAGHLASIGTPEARAAVKTRIAQGKVQMRIVIGGAGSSDGLAFLLSEGRKFRVAMPFEFANYWGEHFFSDGDKYAIGFSQPSVRSVLGGFFDRFNSILKEGLMGGVLSTAWPLLDREGREPKLDYKGLKKVDGKDLHTIVYRMKKGQEDEVLTLSFEPETFRHVKSVYDVTIEPQMAKRANQSSKQVEGRYMIEEMFSDFAPFDGLTLPTHWTIRSNVTGNASRIREWGVIFDKIVHNQPIDPKAWVIDQTVK